jgi:hypothetical protein
VLAREAELAADPGAQADFWAALGDVRLQAPGQHRRRHRRLPGGAGPRPHHAGALAALRGLLGGRDLRPSVLDILEPLAETRGDFAELLVLYEARLWPRGRARPRRRCGCGRIAELPSRS